MRFSLQPKRISAYRFGEEVSDMRHAVRKRHNNVTIDDGRKLLAISTLSAGGGVILVVLLGLGYSVFSYSKAPTWIQIIAACFGIVGAFLYLYRTSKMIGGDGKH
jgi:hypothetical protein